MGEADASLQDFHYTFVCGTRLEKLTFRTFRAECHEEELSEIHNVKGDPEIIKKMNGFVDGRVVEREHAENTRQAYVNQTSLLKGDEGRSRTIRWKLYYTPDMGKSEPEEEFAGFVGVSLLESKLLEPHMAIVSKYQNKRLGTKAVLSVVAKLLTQKAWLSKNVAGVYMSVQRRNTECLALKDKLGLNQIVEQSNPRRKDGIWLDNYKYLSDKKTRTIKMRHFICNSNNFLVSLFESFTHPAINNREHLLMDKAIKAGMLLNDVEASLQQFAYLFDDGPKQEKLLFRTCTRPGSHIELEEILSVLGDEETINLYGFETKVVNVEHARIKQEIMRQEISFEGSRRRIMWRVSFSDESKQGQSKEVFVGYAALADLGRTLEPRICLHQDYRRRGIGTKIFMCLMMKLLKHKSWLKETFDDILIAVNAENLDCLALKDKLLEGLDTEEMNGENENGLWTSKRTSHPSGEEIVVSSRRFRSRCFPVLRRALLLKQAGTFKGNSFPYFDKSGRKNYTLTPVEPYPNVGVKAVSVYPEDVRSLIQHLLSRDATPIEQELNIVNNFEVKLPLQASMPRWRSGTFFLLFFAEECQMQSFEVPEYPSARRHIEQEYIAFEKIYKRTQGLDVRFPNDYTGTLKAYLAEVDLDIFEKQETIQSGLRRLWTSTEFRYARNKKRRWSSEYEHFLVLRETLAGFNFFA